MSSAKQMAKKILEGRGITQVVVVDDAVSEPQWYGLFELLDTEDKVEIIQEFGITLRPTAWREQLDETSMVTNRQLKARVNQVFNERGIPRPESIPRDSILSTLQNTLSKFNPIMLTPQQWLARKSELLGAAEDEPTLFLIDEELGGGRQGGSYISDLPFDTLHHCHFCLFTAETEIDEEFDYWQQKCVEHGFGPGEVGIIAKAHLSTEDQVGFVRMLKLSLTARDVEKIRQSIISSTRIAIDTAIERFESLDLPSLTAIVFESSDVEGIWELETIVRIVKVLIEDSLDNQIYNEIEIAEAIDNIGASAAVSTRADNRLSKASFEIQRAERYITGDYFSSQRMPLSNGDIFEIDDGADASSLWMLVAQPCELAIRSTGERNGAPTHQIVLPIQLLEEATRDDHMTLKHFSPPSLEKAFVRLTKPAYVPTEILDLAAFSAGGEAVWARGTEVEAMRVVGWEKRATKVAEQFEGAFHDLDHLDDISRNHIINLRLPAAQHPAVHPLVNEDTIRYPIKRVGRLRERPAEAVLQAFGLALSRTAEAHDLARISPSSLD